MGFYRDRQYYDELYQKQDKYLLPWHQSPYRALWGRVINQVKAINGKAPRYEMDIVDVGCGTGQFGAMLAHYGFTTYTGFDFSEKAIQIAGKMIPGARLYVGDARQPDHWPDHYKVITLLEVLEHINKDLRILDNIPSSRHVIFTVPDFDDHAHVRYFSNVEEVALHYSKKIDLKRLEYYDRWFLGYGIKK